MTCINLFRNAAESVSPESVTWGKINFVKNVFDASSPFVFAAALIACSLAVGCSSEKPQSTTSTSQPPVVPAPQIATTTAPVPVAATPETAAKPAHKRVVRKAPASVTYADKTTGISFKYPRSYGLRTGDAAAEIFSGDALAMDFVQSGGVPLAVVALPESAYPKSNLDGAYFDVSLNKTLAAEQCGMFSVPQAEPAKPGDGTVQTAAQTPTPAVGKLMLDDMELQSAETSNSINSEKGTREESARYYHVFENGACYEFGLKVSTTKGSAESTDSGIKTVDREEVFHRLEKILATVKINPVTADGNAEAKVNSEVKTAVTAASPAQ